MGIKNKTKGFTLIELVITIGLLMVAVLVIYTIYDTGTKTFRSQSSQIVAENELRDSMDRILLECRKGISYSDIDKSITCTDYVDTFRIDGTTLKMIQTDRTTSAVTEVILGYDVASMDFEVDTENINIKLYSSIKDAKGDTIFVEAVYYKR